MKEEGTGERRGKGRRRTRSQRTQTNNSMRKDEGNIIKEEGKEGTEKY